MQTPLLGTDPNPDIVVVPPPPRPGGAVWRVVARARVRRHERPRGLDPVVVLTGYVLLLFLVPSRLVLPGLGGIGTPANMYALVAFLWLGASWMMRRVSPLPGTRPARLGMALFAVAALLSYVSAARRGASALEVNAADRGLIQLVAWIGLLLLALSIDEEDRLRRLLRRVVAVATVVAVVAIGEFFLHRSLTAWITIPGLEVTSAGGVISRGSFTRPAATAGHPLELATVMAMELPFALYQAFRMPDLGRVRRWAPVGLIALAALVTVSRTAIIGLVAVMLVLMPTWSPQRRWPAAGLMVVGLGGVQVLIPGLLRTIYNLFSAMFSGGDTSTQSRTDTFSAILDYLSDSPWTGRGFGTFLPALYRYTDNMYLLVLVEMGIIGVVSLVGLMLAFLHCAGAGRRRFRDADRRELGWSFTAAAAVVILCTATFDTLSFPMVSGLFFLLLGLSGSYLGIARQQATTQPELSR